MKNKRKNKKVEKKNKTGRRIIVDYCCNPQCFVCGGTKIDKYNLKK
jgi:hypothetical protein